MKLKIKVTIVSVLFTVIGFFANAQGTTMTSLYPNARGWINKYEDLYIKGLIKVTDSVKIPSTHAKTLMLERTYLPESYPTLLYATHISDIHWTKKDKTKLLLFECFLNVYKQTNVLPSDNLDDFINSLSVFYHGDTSKLINKLLKTHFLELKITHKIQIPRNWFRNPMWYRSEVNALILNEVEQYKSFLKIGEKYAKAVEDSIDNQSIAFVVAEARKDYILQCKEKELFDFYLASARITPKERRTWRDRFANADTTHYTNGSIKKGEQDFTNNENCTDNFAKWKTEAGFKWGKIRKRNNYKFQKEFRETGEFFSLISKSFKSDLTTDERAKVKQQSIDLAMVIPSAIIFIIPGGSLILPVALMYIPALCPSAFRDNSLKN
jgi:hypothetical protein